jgi:hypothetical protein
MHYKIFIDISGNHSLNVSSRQCQVSLEGENCLWLTGPDKLDMAKKKTWAKPTDIRKGNNPDYNFRLEKCWKPVNDGN